MENNFENMLNEAYSLHVSGKLEEAEAAYKKLLEIDSSNLDVKNLYAKLCFALKNYDKALELFKEIHEKLPVDDIKIDIIKVYTAQNDYKNVLETAETVSEITNDLLRLKAQAYSGLQNHQKAAEIYRQIINRGRASLNDLFNLSVSYYKQGDFDSALKYALTAYEINKKDKDILLHLAAIYDGKDDNENQLKYLANAAALSPSADIYYNAGVLAKRLNKDAEALEYFKAAVNLNPDYKNAYLNIARIFRGYDKYVSAQIYRELAEKYSNDPDILIQLYIEYSEMMNYSAAYDTAMQLLKIAPEEHISYLFAADSVRDKGRYEEAAELYKKAGELGGSVQGCDEQIAGIYSVINQNDKAEAVYEKYPELKKTSYTYAFITLRGKNLDKARDAMHQNLVKVKKEADVDKRAQSLFYKFGIDKRYGIKLSDFKKYKTEEIVQSLERLEYYAARDLYGSSPDNKRIFIYNNDGMGDVIMFSRYINVLAKHTSKITLFAPKSIYRLLKYNFPKCEVLADEGVLIDDSHYDYTTSFFSLLVSLKENSLLEIPYSSGYLSVSKDLIEEKSRLDVFKTDKKKIGIFWMGSAGGMSHRCIKLEEMLPLFSIPDIQFYSFELTDIDWESEQLKKTLPIVDLAPYIKDYADTAALLKNIDMLITIDTSIANLSGAMGVKTFMLLPFESEWRWFYDTRTTPWYDSTVIFKQTAPGNWKDVIERVKNELEI